GPAGAAAGRRTPVRALPGAARSRHRGAAGGAARTGAAPPAGAHLQRRRAGRAARAGEPAVATAGAAPAHLRRLLLAAGRDRAACLRSVSARTRRRRPRRRRTDDPRGQVPQVPPRPPPPERDRGAPPLRRRAPRPLRPGRATVLPHRAVPRAHTGRGGEDVQPDPAAARLDRRGPDRAPAYPRPAPPVR